MDIRLLDLLSKACHKIKINLQYYHLISAKQYKKLEINLKESYNF